MRILNLNLKQVQLLFDFRFSSSLGKEIDFAVDAIMARND